jgi:hypothetical protein
MEMVWSPGDGQMSGIETIGVLTLIYFMLGVVKFIYWVAKALVILTVLFLVGAFLWMSVFGTVLPFG